MSKKKELSSIEQPKEVHETMEMLKIRARNLEAERQAFSVKIEQSVTEIKTKIEQRVTEFSTSMEEKTQELLKLMESTCDEVTEKETKLQNEKDMMQSIHIEPTDIITINCRGTKVTCPRSTLCTVEDSILGAMFSGRWEDKVTRDDKGNVFLDVNGKCFKLLINILSSHRFCESNPSKPKGYGAPKIPQDIKNAFWNMADYLGVKSFLQPREPLRFLHQRSENCKFSNENRTIESMDTNRWSRCFLGHLSSPDTWPGENNICNFTVRMDREENATPVMGYCLFDNSNDHCVAGNGNCYGSDKTMDNTGVELRSGSIVHMNYDRSLNEISYCVDNGQTIVVFQGSSVTGDVFPYVFGYGYTIVD